MVEEFLGAVAAAATWKVAEQTCRLYRVAELHSSLQLSACLKHSRTPDPGSFATFSDDRGRMRST